MSMLEPEEVARALELDGAWAEQLRNQWLGLMDLAVFGDLKSKRLGALSRLRKKVLDGGEKLRSLLADRDWIPQPREQLKNALASALALEQALAELEMGARELEGGADLEAYRAVVSELCNAARDELRIRSNEWAWLLDRRP
jgi:hypothetical protein